jgi:hypothetical protein
LKQYGFQVKTLRARNLSPNKFLFFTELQNNCPGVPIILAGTKSDLRKRARNLGTLAKLVETSEVVFNFSTNS